MRLVLDTNIVLSSLLWRGATYQLLTQIRQHPSIQLHSSQTLIEELAEVLTRPHCLKRLALIKQSGAEVLADYLQIVELVEPVTIPPTSRDPDDDAVLACALAAEADFIVSGDQDLLVLQSFRGIRIINAADALEIIGTS